MPKVFSDQGWTSGPLRSIGAPAGTTPVDPGPDPPPPPPPNGNLRTYMGMSQYDQSLWGNLGTVPDGTQTDLNAAHWIDASTGYIDVARSLGAQIMMKVTPGNAHLKDSAGNFSPNLWKGYFDGWWNGLGTSGRTKVRAAVADGTIKGLYMLDDFSSSFGDNSFSREVSFDEFESASSGIAYHVKVTRAMPWLPCLARGLNSQLSARPGRAGRDYAYLDAGWMQYRFDRFGDLSTFINSEWSVGRGIGLAGFGGGNLNGGGSWVWDSTGLRDPKVNRLHGDTIWRRRPFSETTLGYSQRMHPGASDELFGMSPLEIKRLVNAYAADPRVCGLNFWTYGINSLTIAYYNRTQFGTGSSDDINGALAYCAGVMANRVEGPINIRGDLVAA